MIKEKNLTVAPKKDMPTNSPQRPWKHIIVLAVLVIGLLIWKFKGYFIAATVNGQPISKSQLNEQLLKKFGKQILDSMINERLIIAAARQKGIFITAAEITGRIKQIEEQLKGKVSLDEALKAQGLSTDDFKRQLEIQISIEKMFEKESTISGKEVDDYYNTNKRLYKEATDTAIVKNEIEKILKQQKTSDSFEKWFSDIRKNAKVQVFL